ncbi:hypothetical protein ABTD77_19625, partial [Acinetobacter baumannii]
PFRSGNDLLTMGSASGIAVADMVMANEVARLPREEVEAKLDHIIEVMMSCIDRGMVTDGNLPGGLDVRRRAPSLHLRLREAAKANSRAQ